MSIFRTVKKIRECEACKGMGVVYTIEGGTEITHKCLVCDGTGRVEIYARVSQAAAQNASNAAKTLPPAQRAAVKKRLRDHEPEPGDQALPPAGNDGKVGRGFVDEDT